MKKIGVIHTTKATVDSLTELIKRIVQNAEVYNILDDSILPDMAAQRGAEMVRWRFMEYAKILEKMNADIILSACSTMGEFAEEANQMLTVPVLRIDEAMAEEAVLAGVCICVFATLKSTLGPTARLIERKASRTGRVIELHTVLVEGAYDALIAGNKEIHDKKISDSVKEHIEDTDVIVLAQASMASAIPAEEVPVGIHILTSPKSGVEKLKAVL